MLDGAGYLSRTFPFPRAGPRKTGSADHRRIRMKRTRCIFFSWLIFLGSFVGRSEAAERARDERPFPEPGSKKGLQVQMIEDGLTLGIKHATLNVSLGSLIDLEH